MYNRIDSNQSNFLQIENLKELILSSNPKSVAILGVAFKSDTDDIRNSPIILLTNLLIENDVEVKLWDDNLDVNFDNQVNVIDIVKMVNWIIYGTPE